MFYTTYTIRVSRLRTPKISSSRLRCLTFFPSFVLALKRTDSSSDSTRRKDSTVSKVSDHESKMEERVPESPQKVPVPESPLYDVPGEEEELEENMPWLKVVARVANGFNFYCTHQGFCHPSCFRRQMRASKRIMVAARRVSEVANSRAFRDLSIILFSDLRRGGGVHGGHLFRRTRRSLWHRPSRAPPLRGRSLCGRRGRRRRRWRPRPGRSSAAQPELQ